MFKWAKNKITNTKLNIQDTSKKLSGYEQIEENAKEIKSMAQVILSPNDQIKNAHKETFTTALKRMNVNEKQLIINYRNFTYICYISLAFTLLCFLFALYKLIIEQNIVGFLPVFAIMLLCLANAFKYSFRAFQIKHQKLCSVSDWWKRSREWFPKI